MRRLGSAAIAVAVTLALAAGAVANPNPTHTFTLNGNNSNGGTINLGASYPGGGLAIVNGQAYVITCVNPVSADNTGRHEVLMNGRNEIGAQIFIRYTSFSVGHQWGAQTTPGPGPCLADIYVYPAIGTYTFVP